MKGTRATTAMNPIPLLASVGPLAPLNLSEHVQQKLLLLHRNKVVKAMKPALRGRSRQNFAMLGISPLLEAPILFIIEKITEVLYSIPLKWEPHGQVAIRGEASMILHVQPQTMQHVVQQGFGLQRKGVVQKLSEVVNGTVTAEWEQWVDAYSLSARSVLRSLFPALLYKSLLYAPTRQDVVANLRSLLWGCGVRRYPDQWWHPILYRFFHRFRLHRIVGFQRMVGWFREGKQIPGA